MSESKDDNGGILSGVRAKVGNISVRQSEDQVAVERQIEMEDEIASPIAETVNDAREELRNSEHTTDFDLYDEMLNLDPELSGAVRAMSQSGSNYKITIPTDEPSEREQTAYEDIKELERRLELPLLLADVLKKLISHGNDINKMIYSEENGIERLQNFPTSSITIVEEEDNIISGENEDNTDDILDLVQRSSESEEISTNDLNEVFDRGLYVLNEATRDVSYNTIDPQDIIHFSIDERSNWHTDVMGRDTYGVWGQSRLEPLTFTIQTKYNTLTNKVAMDDSLLAREIYYIDTASLFGDISDREKRQKKAEEYAQELKSKIEKLGPDERPMIPEEVDVEVIGPEGKAIDQTPFIEQLNNSIAAALTFPMAGLGRGTTSVKAGEEISSLWAENNIKNLRQALNFRIREIFRNHITLLHNDWRDEDGQELKDMKLDPDITIPTLEYEPFREKDRSEIVSQIKGLVSTKSITLEERRELFGLDTDEETIRKVREEYPGGSPAPGDGVSSNDPDPEGVSRGEIPEDASVEDNEPGDVEDER